MGCGLPTGSEPEPHTIVIAPSLVSLDAIGATQSLTAQARDENDLPVPDVTFSWASSDASIATISSMGLVTAVGLGDATITATGGNTSGAVRVSVVQLASRLVMVGGDSQVGAAGVALPAPLAVQALDRLDNPAADVPLEFQVLLGDGSLSIANVRTSVDGTASSTWTLGTLAEQQQRARAFLSFRVGEGVEFRATSVAGPASKIVSVGGDGQAAPRLSTLSDPLRVRIEDAFQNPVGGVSVEFVVLSGQGSLQPATVDTDAAGIASASWTLGSPLGTQSVSATVGALPATPFTAVATEVPVQVDIVNGDGQAGVVGEQLPLAPSVQVLAAGGVPVPSLDVRFSVSAGNGLVVPTGGGDGEAALTVRTDPNGTATVGGWVLGTAPGTHEVLAEVPGLSPVVFMATASTGPPAILTKASGDGQRGDPGVVLPAPIVVEVADEFGNPVSGAGVTFAPGTGSGSVTPPQTVTNSFGLASTLWTLGTSVGSQSVTVSVAGAPSVVFEAAAAGVGGLTIDLQYIDQPTAAQMQAFDDAVSQWSAVIPGRLDPVNVQIGAGGCVEETPAINQLVDDVLVLVKLESIDGISGTLGQAGICAVRLTTGLPIVARLTLDIDDVGRLEVGGRLVDLILHELAHALGFGTLWVGKGLLANPSLPSSSGADTHFTGPNAIAAFDAIGGTAYTAGQKVPVENTEGGSGTRDSHWRTAVFANELMTGFLTTGENPLSRVTVASLQDLGYQVDQLAADSFQLPSAALVAEPEEGVDGRLFLGDDVYRGPVYVIDSEGNIRGVLR